MCEVVNSCSHLESLAFKVLDFEKESGIKTSLFGTSLDLDRHHLTTLDVADLLMSPSQSELVRALASNLKLARVNVKGVLLTKDDFKRLAYGASKSLNLTEFAMTPACVFTARYGEAHGALKCCLVHRANAWTGESIENIALADILEATRRNASAVLAAAKFVLREEDGVEAARSIELMHDHPRLLEMVSEGADVTKAAAKEMISSALLRVRHLSLDEFMRMTGVVKKTAECLADPGTRRQLCDLNLECWLHIRRFLKIADVLQPRADLCENGWK
ncbi:uncharacterized protein [Dermacentor albipictus]|uniref:uncharacterized protein n=1 Tax=Dermacentor albipictus TaxID=60249 RepID=UPI0038FBF364